MKAELVQSKVGFGKMFMPGRHAKWIAVVGADKAAVESGMDLAWKGWLGGVWCIQREDDAREPATGRRSEGGGG